MGHGGSTAAFFAFATSPFVGLSIIWVVLVVTVAIGLVIAVHHAIPRADE